jgi:glutamine amidotransferase
VSVTVTASVSEAESGTEAGTEAEAESEARAVVHLRHRAAPGCHARLRRWLAAAAATTITRLIRLEPTHCQKPDLTNSSVAILDYDAGNLTSVACAVRHLGREPLITRDPDEVRAAARVIFPGVGAAGAAMENLRRLGLDEPLRRAVGDGKPVLGICVGCQVVFEESEEDGGTRCLGILPGSVRRFHFPPGGERKVPHMGWNEVHFQDGHPLFRGIPPGSQFYFVHSFYPVPRDDALVQGTAVYGGVRFAAAVARGNLAAVQFHTEKSGPPGLRLLENFLAWSP